LALCLSGASQSPAPSPIPSPRGIQPSNQHPNDQQPNAQEQNQPADQPSAANPRPAPYQQSVSPKIKDKNKQHLTDVSARLISVNIDRDGFDILSLILTGLLVVVGACYTVFARRQWKAISGQTEILETATTAQSLAAGASMRSAEVAQAALRADRPFLLIEESRLENFQSEGEVFKRGALADGQEVRAIFKFSNCGKSPAIVTKIEGRLFLSKTLQPIKLDEGLDAEDFPNWGDLNVRWITPLRNVIAVGTTSPPYTLVLDTGRYRGVTTGCLSDTTFRQLSDHKLVVMLFGYVRYTDVLQRKHETEFRGTYNPPSPEEPQGSFFWEFCDHAQRENEGG
jgi:hypothetical protein